MKKLLPILVFLCLISSLAFAQPRSILKIRLSDFSPISVAIDRRFYNEENSIITIRNFPSGTHYIRVFRWSYSGNRNRLVYEGEINLMPNTFSVVVIDRRTGLARISNRRMNDNYNDGNAYDWDRNEHFSDRGTFDDDDRNNHQGNNNEHYQYGNNSYGSNQGNNSNYYNGNNNNYGQNSGNNNNQYNPNNSNFSQQDMSDLQSRVADRITDTDKLKLLQSALKNRFFYTEQARQMLSWLSFESTKLDFAKWAYSNISDKNNYWKIESEFSFESTKTEFNDFLNNKR